jgi:hypothetical protein
VVVTEARVNEKYTCAMWVKPPFAIGFDGMPSQASEPSTVYDAKLRYWSFTPNAGVHDTVALVEFDITLKRDVEPVNPTGLFPSFGPVFGQSCWWLQDGKPVTGTLGKAPVDIPVGGMAGGVVALTPGLRVVNGEFGIAPPADGPALLRKGTRYVARFLIPVPVSAGYRSNFSFDADPGKWMRAMGVGGETPYVLSLTRGKLEQTTYFATLTSANNGVAGQVAKAADLGFPLPLRVPVNGNWPAGIWRDGETVEYAGAFEGLAWPLLDVGKPGRFYAGNLLTADNPALVLEIVTWTKDAITVEAHNPTDAPITATLQTPREISNYCALTRQVTVPAGTSVVVKSGTP